MVYINEWLPDPVGADTAGEFIELYNDGDTAVKLDDWAIETEKGKTFLLTRRIVPARRYLVLTKSDTRLTLRNADGGLALYDARGTLVDQGAFGGSAPEGKSFSRANYNAGQGSTFYLRTSYPWRAEHGSRG